MKPSSEVLVLTSFLAPPCTYPTCLAHWDLSVWALHVVWLKPFSSSDPAAQNVQRDPVGIPPNFQRPVTYHYLIEPSPGPTRFRLYLLCLIQSTPFVLVYLEHSSLDGITCLLLSSPPHDELTGWGLGLIHFCMSKGFLRHQVAASVYGY